MYIETSAQYQDALRILDSLHTKEMKNLTHEEKQLLNETLRAIESYQYRNDPVSVLATYA